MNKKVDRELSARWILATLEKNGFEARLAGGCVRDRCLGNIPLDYDIATTALPNKVTEIFTREKIKVVPTGIDHGTVTLVLSGIPFEVTTLREDVRTDGRHAEVVFGTSFERDAARRDFTINALFEDHSGKIYDYFGGQEDLRSRQLRFVGEPRHRIQEDYLRILRFFRFWARFNLQPTAEALKAIALEAQGLSRISKERITTELLGLLSTPKPQHVVAAMATAGVLAAIYRDTPITALDGRIDACEPLSPSNRALARLALLLGEGIRLHGEPLIGQYFRLSKHQSHRIVSLATLSQNLLDSFFENQSLAMALLDEIERFWPGELLSDFLPAAEILFPEKSHHVRWLAQLERDQGWLRTSPMPVDAAALMQTLGIPAGPQLGKLLKALQTHFRNRKWTFREEGLALATELLEEITKEGGT